jgi:dnaB-like helicase C terminal domain
MKYDNSKLEQELIAILLYHPEETNKLVLEEECIYDPLNRFILKLFKKQYQEYKLIDLSGLISNYKTEFTPKYTENAVIDRITTCMSECIGASAKFEYYQETIFKNYINSEIMKLIEEFRQLKITNEELLNGIHLLENKTIKLNQNLLTAEEIFRIINSKNKNINFRFKQLSETANIQEHDLVIVAARTGIGKSGFILNLIEDMSDKYNCILFNMEIAEKQIYQRLLAINTNIPMSYHDNPATLHQ